MRKSLAPTQSAQLLLILAQCLLAPGSEPPAPPPGWGLPCPDPEGAFYCFPNITPTGLSSDAFTEQLLREVLAGAAPSGRPRLTPAAGHNSGAVALFEATQRPGVPAASLAAQAAALLARLGKR